MIKKMITKLFTVRRLLLIVAPLVIVVCFLLSSPWQLPERAVAGQKQAQFNGFQGQEARESTVGAEKPQLAEFDEAEFLSKLEQKFAGVIEVKHAQIRMLEQLISYLKSRYPDDWESRVEAMLLQMYPELAGELIAKYQAWSNYNAWLITERDTLRAMSPTERRDALWAKRFDAFGGDAELIWAAELRNRKIEDALIAVEEMAESRPEEKLTHFVESVRGALGDKAEPLLTARRTELMDRFLSLDSVQQALRGMPESARLTSLREIRSGLGMDAEALERWTALDQRRDRVWAAGSEYMQQRQSILAEYSGSEQVRLMASLRATLFPEQSAVIQREEESGFFRFAGERRIGRE